MNREPSARSLQLAAPHRAKVIDGEVLLVSDKIPEDPAIRELAVAYREEIRRTKLDLDDPAMLGADMVPGVQGGRRLRGQ